MSSTLALRAAIESLASRHGVATAPSKVPLLDRVAFGPSIIVEGVCSSPAPDCERVVFLPGCFGPLGGARIPLLLNHRDPAGCVLELGYDAGGSVVVRAEVTDAAAQRCPAFSVAAKVSAFALRRQDRPDFVAEVTQAELIEVSLTDTPRNPRALVTGRSPLPPCAQFYDLMIARTSVLIRMVGLMKELADRDGAPPPPVLPAAHGDDEGDDGDDARLRAWLTREVRA